MKTTDIATVENITLSIDNEEFNISVREVNKREKKAFSERQREEIEKREETNRVQTKIERLKKTFSLNEEILADKNSKESRSTIAKEQKELICLLEQLESELPQDNEFSLEDVIEELLEERFETTVSGEDKEKLKKTIEDKDINYATIFTIFAKKFQEQKEKK